jgi:hypothetical protein
VAFDCGEAGIVTGYGYIPASGADADWLAYASSYDDKVSGRTWTPVISSSGGGAQGTMTHTSWIDRIGRMVKFNTEISCTKGTLAAGTLSISGLPYVGRTGALQGVEVTSWSGITFTANVFTMSAFVSSASISLRKLHAAGGSSSGLTLAECADPIVLTVEGEYWMD